MRRLRDAGELSPFQAAVFVRPRAAEELYDLKADPDERINLVGDPTAAAMLTEMRKTLAEWTRETADSMPGRPSPDEFNRETGEPLPDRVRPRPLKARP